jgi:pimeloyl-ACP methyl ester carboxylesterase
MNSFSIVKSGLSLCIAVFILISMGTAFAQSSSNDDIHISAIAEFYVLHSYPQLKGHRALAAGPGGYWADSFGKISGDIAGKAALKSCTATLRTSKYKSLARRDCVLFDIDGKRTGKAAPTGISFGTAAQGPDIPYEKGGQWEATGSQHRGTVILLHGCNRLDGVVSGWVRAWINFYRASGFRVIMPDSFAEPRDRDVCGPPGEDGIDAQTRNLKLRVAQTLRTIATVRQKYPGEPIYVHGHSEGGYVAQALGEKLAGVIVTGAPCGFGDAAAYWVADGTPVLVIAGTKDAYFSLARTAKALTSYCKTVRGAGKLETVSVDGMGHFTGLWWPQVRKGIAAFLDSEPIAIARRKTDGTTLPAIAPSDLAEYQKAPTPKAFAADANGKRSWYATENAQFSSGETRLDVEEMALFDCDEKAGMDAFRDAAHQHACVLVDVNGKPAK